MKNNLGIKAPITYKPIGDKNKFINDKRKPTTNNFINENSSLQDNFTRPLMNPDSFTEKRENPTYNVHSKFLALLNLFEIVT